MRKISNVLLLGFTSILNHSICAQPILSSKVITNSGSYGCTMQSVSYAFDSGYMIVGRAGENATVTKVDSAGSVVWVKLIGDGSFRDIVKTIDSAFVIVGQTLTGKIVCTKINLDGDTIWFRTLTSNTSLDVYGLEKTLDAGVVMTGLKYESNAPGFLTFVAKLDADGNLEWSKYFTMGNSSNIGYSIRQSADSSYVICGAYSDYPPFAPYAFIINIDAAANVLWAKKYHVPSFLYVAAYDVLISNEGFQLYCDVSGSIYLVSCNSNGEVLWSKRYDYFGNGDQAGNIKTPRIHRTVDGSYILTHGSCWGSALIKVDSSGNLIFGKELQLATIDALETADNGLMVFGNGPMCGLKSTIQDPQIGIIQTDSFGNGSMCVLQDINNQPLDSVIISETATVISTNGAVSTISFPQIGSVVLLADEGCVAQGSGIDVQSNTMTVFPNPTVDFIHITSDNGKKDFSIHDIAGHKLLDTSSLESEFDIDLSKFSQGLYLLTIIKDSISHRFKIIRQ